jgi:hypothetical protein
MLPSAAGPTLSRRLPFLLTMSTNESTSSSTERKAAASSVRL